MARMFCLSSNRIAADGCEEYIRENTGLRIDAYFSATKIKWLLDNIPGARERAKRGELLFGTVDTWLLWRMTEGRVHATDYTNASRTRCGSAARFSDPTEWWFPAGW